MTTPLGGRPLGALGVARDRQGYARVFGPGSTTWSVPYSGRWKFALHGAGGNWDGGTGVNGGASGAYVEWTVPLSAGIQVAIEAGAGHSGTDTTVTVSGYPVATAGAAVTTTPGVASGGDLRLNGSAGGNNATGASGLGTGGGVGGAADGSGHGGGAGAPGSLEFPGGRGQDANTPQTTGVTPGGGSALNASSVPGPGGDGRVVAVLVGF